MVFLGGFTGYAGFRGFMRFGGGEEVLRVESLFGGARVQADARMFPPLLQTVLNRDFNRGYYDPY